MTDTFWFPCSSWACVGARCIHLWIKGVKRDALSSRTLWVFPPTWEVLHTAWNTWKFCLDRFQWALQAALCILGFLICGKVAAIFKCWSRSHCNPLELPSYILSCMWRGQGASPHTRQEHFGASKDCHQSGGVLSQTVQWCCLLIALTVRGWLGFYEGLIRDTEQLIMWLFHCLPTNNEQKSPHSLVFYCSAITCYCWGMGQWRRMTRDGCSCLFNFLSVTQSWIQFLVGKLDVNLVGNSCGTWRTSAREMENRGERLVGTTTS